MLLRAYRGWISACRGFGDAETDASGASNHDSCADRHRGRPGKPNDPRCPQALRLWYREPLQLLPRQHSPDSHIGRRLAGRLSIIGADLLESCFTSLANAWRLEDE